MCSAACLPQAPVSVPTGVCWITGLSPGANWQGPWSISLLFCPPPLPGNGGGEDLLLGVETHRQLGADSGSPHCSSVCWVVTLVALAHVRAPSFPRTPVRATQCVLGKPGDGSHDGMSVPLETSWSGGFCVPEPPRGLCIYCWPWLTFLLTHTLSINPVPAAVLAHPHPASAPGGGSPEEH